MNYYLFDIKYCALYILTKYNYKSLYLYLNNYKSFFIINKKNSKNLLSNSKNF